jgi:hypothetical protein
VRAGRTLRALAGLAVLLVFVFVAGSVDARGGRGGGGRGGGGFSRGGGGLSRGGAASSGSFRTPSTASRPSYSRSGAYGTQRPSQVQTRPAQRPATQPARPQPTPQPGQRPSTQPGQRPSAQPGERPGQQPSRGEQRPDAPDREGAREDWQQHREDMQQDRQEYGKKAREDWQEYAEWDEGGGYWVGGWYGPVVYDDDVDEWTTFVAGITIGTALSSAAYHSMQSETECSPTEVVVNQITYLKCGTKWYNRVMQGGSVSYVVVSPPPGF